MHLNGVSFLRFFINVRGHIESSTSMPAAFSAS